MGADKGFDMIPALSNTPEDNQRWERFLNQVKRKYADDPAFQVRPNYVVFELGEHPKLLLKGHKFRRFSAKITGRIATSAGVERYLDEVTTIATLHFGGDRIFRWNELSDVWGFYGWNEVRSAEES
jgi:hypothetical protein